VARRIAAGQRNRAAGRREIGDVDVVLDGDRNAVQRAAPAAAAALGIERAGGLDRARVDLEDRVEVRSLLVIGVDAGEVQRDQPLVSQRAGVDRRLDAGDARRQQVERSRRRRQARRRRQQQRRNQRGKRATHGAKPSTSAMIRRCRRSSRASPCITAT
jgi:hypothetical protein